MKQYAKKFYLSKAWKECRDSYFQAKHGLCERCGGLGDIVHHKKYINPDNINDIDITLSWGNLELLCQNCHNKEHFAKYEVLQDGLMFNENGDLIEL